MFLKHFRIHPSSSTESTEEPENPHEVHEAKERSSTLKREHESTADREYGGEESQPLEVTLRFTIHDSSQIGRLALLLAATTSTEEEDKLREAMKGWKWRAVATEVGGVAGDLPQKITRSIVGAAPNAGVVEKRRAEMHALMHAAMEAMNSFMVM
ncbi:MAG: hypothetical protein K9L28_00460, partial [Synergistales bacterium]|nr:hypothetical protein [Synergistales bacterium]